LGVVRHYSYMPRLPRLAFAGIPHRITQRGNCRQKNYFRAEDDRLYLQLLKDYARHHGVAVLSYCRMLNDIHFGLCPSPWRRRPQLLPNAQ